MKEIKIGVNPFRLAMALGLLLVLTASQCLDVPALFFMGLMTSAMNPVIGLLASTIPGYSTEQIIALLLGSLIGITQWVMIIRMEKKVFG